MEINTEPVIIESVPNFSEGRNRSTIEAIVRAAASVDGAAVLHVDIGHAANRTVVTIAGRPEAVCEASFRAVEQAAMLIDMSTHTGRHPRIGATDVLPLVPVSGITLNRCVAMARNLGRRIGNELNIPVYLYEEAATEPHRRPLEACRHGQYEGLAAKMCHPQWTPDYGPVLYDQHVAASGLTVVGARDFLGAVNFNLDTEDAGVAQDIARSIRASSHGPSSIPFLKAIGWFIDEYKFAQVSTNLTNMRVTDIWQVYKAVQQQALLHGTELTGTELIGMLPLWVLTDAGRKISGRANLDDSQALDAAVRSLGLDTMQLQGHAFDPSKKIIEYALENQRHKISE